MQDYRARRSRRGKVFKFGSLRIPRKLGDVFLWSKIIRLALYGAIALVIIIPLLFLWYSRDLPTPGKLVTAKYNDSTRIYDRKGVLLYSVYQEQNRTYIPLEQTPTVLQEATIAIEDKDFYKHGGFDPLTPFRIAYNVVFKQRVIGGSTLTQQLVKLVILGDSSRTPTRKIKELILAIQVDQKFSKNQILEMYLNNIPYGGTAVGVEAAAESYFGKKAKDLDLAESAFLAGLPQSPTAYSPFSGNKYYLPRMKDVLGQMVDNNYITQEESDAAYAKIEKYQFSQKDSTIKAPHFVMYVKQLLADKFGDSMVEKGGLQVTTTLDYALQKKSEEIVKSEMKKLKGYNVTNAASMVTTPGNGEILSMVGSVDYFDTTNDGNFNVAWKGQRQPGSSLKPVVYAAGLEKGYTPATMLMDVSTEFPGSDAEHPYRPVNYDGKFRGPVQVRFALGNSLNIPAVKMLSKVGLRPVMEKAYEMGISNWEPTTESMKNVGLSLVLGGRETTLMDEMTAYGVFANGGLRQDLVGLLKVTDAKGNVLYEYKKASGKRVLSEETSFLISHILLDDQARKDAFGLGSLLNIPGKTVSVKTGTTDEKRDNWTFGYTPSYVVGVWVGNNDNSKMNQAIASGVTGASPIWHSIMAQVLKGKPDEQFNKPDNVEAMQIDMLTGGLPKDGQPNRSEYFTKGTQPTSVSTVYRNKDGKDFLVFREDDPVSTDGKNRWQEGIDAWIEQYHKGDEKYHAPDELKNLKHEEMKETPTPTAGPTSEPVPTETPTNTPTP